MSAEPPVQGSPKSPSSPSSSQREDAAALVRTIQKNAEAKAKIQEEKRTQKPPSKALYVVLALALLGNAYLWIGRPEWLVGDSSGIDTVAEQEGVLRFRMFVQGQRIESYRAEHGAFPDRLDQTGAPFEGMSYSLTSPTSWELVGMLGEARLLLRSTQTLESFMEGSEGASEVIEP